MNLQNFISQNRLRVKTDRCGEKVIPGRFGHIYDHNNGTRFGVLLMFETKMRWTYAKRKLAAAGFEIRQDGDTEGTALFDPNNSEHAHLAMKVARVKPRRTPSPTQLESLALSREARRIVQAPARRAALEPGSTIASVEGNAACLKAIRRR